MWLAIKQQEEKQSKQAT